MFEWFISAIKKYFDLIHSVTSFQQGEISRSEVIVFALAGTPGSFFSCSLLVSLSKHDILTAVCRLQLYIRRHRVVSENSTVCTYFSHCNFFVNLGLSYNHRNLWTDSDSLASHWLIQLRYLNHEWQLWRAPRNEGYTPSLLLPFHPSILCLSLSTTTVPLHVHSSTTLCFAMFLHKVLFSKTSPWSMKLWWMVVVNLCYQLSHVSVRGHADKKLLSYTRINLCHSA